MTNFVLSAAPFGRSYDEFGHTSRAAAYNLGTPARAAGQTVETYQARPRLDQCALRYEMLVGGQVVFTRLFDHSAQKLRRYVAFLHPVPILGEYRVVTHRFVEVHRDKPPNIML
jgi:hypothetical protein